MEQHHEVRTEGCGNPAVRGILYHTVVLSEALMRLDLRPSLVFSDDDDY